MSETMLCCADKSHRLASIMSQLRSRLFGNGSITVFLDACRDEGALDACRSDDGTAVGVSDHEKWVLCGASDRPRSQYVLCAVAYATRVPRSSTPALFPLCRVHVTVGYASISDTVSFEASGHDLSFYTRALVKSINAFGHQKGVVQLLEEVRAEVTRQTSSLGVTQTPCAYIVKEGKMVLVSLVGSTPLSAGAAVTVGDAVRPVINHPVPQVWLLWALFFGTRILEVQCVHVEAVLGQVSG